MAHFNQATNEFSSCSAAILCGGQSRRMGFDKVFIPVEPGGPFLLEILAQALKKRFAEVMLITKNPEKLITLPGLEGCRPVRDLKEGGGPVGAVHTAIHHSRNETVFVMGCDMPSIDWALTRAMYQRLGDYDAVVPVHDNFFEPLYAFYGKKAEGSFHESVKTGDMTVRRAYERLNMFYYDVLSAGYSLEVFANINQPDDLHLLNKVDSWRFA